MTELVLDVIEGRNFTCMLEGVNALEAWLGSVPGQAYANVRQPPVSTLNLARLIPLSATHVMRRIAGSIGLAAIAGRSGPRFVVFTTP
jgi:type IV secretory pathway VirB4 component